MANAIHVGRIEEIDAQFDRAPQRRQRLRLIRGAIEFLHAHTAEADFRNFDSAGSERSFLHFRLP